MARKRTAHISTLGSQVTSVISVTLVLLILGALAMVLTASHGLSDRLRSNMGFIVKMEPAATDAQVNNIKKTLAKAPFTDRYVFSGADEILAQESEMMGEDIAAMLDENPYGAEFDVKVRPLWAEGDSIEHLATRFGQYPGVDTVVTETAVVNNINSVMHRLGWALFAIGVALLVISCVLINNTVSLAVYSRRFIIHTMKLVGATGGFIRRPFTLAGVATGALSATIAIALLAGLRTWLSTLDAMVDAVLSWQLMIFIFAGVLLAGILICTLASMFATNRYLRAAYDDMFK